MVASGSFARIQPPTSKRLVLSSQMHGGVTWLILIRSTRGWQARPRVSMPRARDAGADCKLCDDCWPQAGRSNVSMPAYRHQQHFARYFNVMLSVGTEPLLDPRRA